MPRYRVPDYLICLGEGGNEVGETFMSQDWILEEVIRDNPREGVEAPDNDTHPLHAFFIDTDNSTLNHQLESNIDEAVEKIEDNHDIQRHPDVDGTVLNVAEGPQERYLQPEQVTADATIKELANDLNLDAWWLEDNSDNRILGPLDGLTRGGVDRKRGLTKAIYRISEWQNDPFEGDDDDLIQSIEDYDDPEVAIVVGVGGGTGSGLFLDVAKRVKEAGAAVTLFGILPTPSGRDDNSVLANAYAALSELEYLTLSEENYFRNIVLLPYDPAVDDDIFDKAATYTITAYYNLQASQSNTYTKFDESQDMDGPPRFAPFTIAATRYLHYLKEDIDETEQNFRDYLEDSEDALDAEEALYERLEEFIDDHHDEALQQLYTTEGGPTIRLPSGDAIALRERIDDIRRLLDKGFMEEIEFWSAGRILEAFEDIESTSQDKAQWEDEDDKAAAVARDLIPRLANGIDDVGQFEPDEGEWTTDEQEFVKSIIHEFRLVARRAGIIRAANAIQAEDESEVAETIATDIENAIDEENRGFGAEVENLISKCKTEISEIEAEIEGLETVVDEAESLADDLTEDWEADVRSSVEELFSLLEKRGEINELLLSDGEGSQSLKTEIKRDMGNLASKREASNITVRETRFDQYGKLNRLLDEAGCTKVDPGTIEDSVKAAKRARKKQLTARERSGTLKEAIRSLLGAGTIGGLREDYRTIVDEDIDRSIMRVSGWSEDFDVALRDEYFDDRASDLETREQELLNQISDRTRTMIETAEAKLADPDGWLGSNGDAAQIVEGFDFEGVDVDQTLVTDHLDPEESDTLENATTGEQLVELLKGGPVQEILSSVLIDPFENELEEQEDELDEKENVLEGYENLGDIVTNAGRTYHSMATAVDSVDSIAAYEEGGRTGPFKVEAKPWSRGKIGNSDHLGETKLWQEKKEREKILDMLEDILPTLGGEYLPINERHIADGDTGQVDYNGHRLGSTFMSPLFEQFDDDETAKIPELTDKLVDNRQFNEADYLAARGAFADSYDFAMTTFLGGVFLDNLQIFTDECHEAYMTGTDVQPNDDRHNHRQSIPSIVQHHTYGLDGSTYHDEDQFLPDKSDGGFCYRRDVMNFNADGAEVLLDQAEEEDANEQAVVEVLLDEYHEIVGFPSAVDLD